MAFKTALVVDDSKSARIALKRLLEEQELGVELAESGEEAIEFLKAHLVDVIFMDHTMPGMDGLEAVAAIKNNPRTATIPVMMYTTKEGEVYVGQARALGAVGVLPKQVQPGQLFEMLLKLGLVKERRVAEDAAEEPARFLAVGDESFDAADREYDQQALGMSVQTLVTRILEDQHRSLRSDILKSQRSFARQVATELYEQHKADADPRLATPSPSHSESRFNLAAASLMVILVVLGLFFWQVRTERDALRAELSEISSNAAVVRQANSAETNNLTANLELEQERYLKLLEGLAWAVNRTGTVPYDELPFNDTRALEVGGLLGQLRNIGFRGTVQIESHLGEYCLVSDETGSYQLADPELPVEACAVLGHPLDDSSFVSERQSADFKLFADSLDGDIVLRLLAYDRLNSEPRYYAAPSITSTAAQWNRIAARNNRIEYLLIPDLP